MADRSIPESGTPPTPCPRMSACFSDNCTCHPSRAVEVSEGPTPEDYYEAAVREFNARVAYWPPEWIRSTAHVDEAVHAAVDVVVEQLDKARARLHEVERALAKSERMAVTWHVRATAHQKAAELAGAKIARLEEQLAASSRPPATIRT